MHARCSSNGCLCPVLIGTCGDAACSAEQLTSCNGKTICKAACAQCCLDPVMMHYRRHYYGKQEHDLAIPDMWRTGLVWGLFMGVSSNTRYQIVFGLERMVDMSIAKKVMVLRAWYIAWAASSMPKANRDKPCQN